MEVGAVVGVEVVAEDVDKRYFMVGVMFPILSFCCLQLLSSQLVSSTLFFSLVHVVNFDQETIS